ncbi:MAG: pirin-like C-terminal cupin domain-containing protein [Rhodoferax sp.]|nr:pirin-like C-terminal cupin domain-containing protein [Rhodoferax sp.]MDD4941931.1 pirin-like C-terminal cupin domain-containing protein [Rhodoferax sp.]MDD5480034.1 pirin-like C-terminal cupin domain-containing protein [Rhodoferax sp.]
MEPQPYCDATTSGASNPETTQLKNESLGAEVLPIAGQPFSPPIFQYGLFMMNSQDEI